MTQPKPSGKTATISQYDAQQPAYEDPDVLVPAVTDGSQSEVKVKPVPPPRFKLQPKAQSITNANTADCVDTASNTANAVSSKVAEYPADYKRPRPVRPPPKPPVSKCVTSSKPTAADDRGIHYIISNTEPTVTPPAVRTERIQPPPPPLPVRPHLPSTCHDRPPSLIRLKSETYSSESQQSGHSPITSLRQIPVSPALSKDVVSPYGTYGSKATHRTDRPAVPPRPGPTSPCPPASVCETSPLQTRPPPPPFKPPPLPPIERPYESLYSEIDSCLYLEILPNDDDGMTQEQSALPSGPHYQSGCNASPQETTKDAGDIDGMLRWLKRMSKSDFMTLTVFGLSIDEEIRSFNQRVMHVTKALHLYNLLMIKHNDSLRVIITEFRSISESLDKMQKTTKTMGIAGGTTGAVGGVTAIVGIALAPVTLGASLIVTAVGAGMVVSAGGMGAHSAKVNKNIVNRMTVEKLVNKYMANIVEVENCLDFILSGMNELRRHDIARLQRAGARPDALTLARLSQSVFGGNVNNDRRASVVQAGGMASEKLLQAFTKELDQYFTGTKDQKLKKSNKSRFSGRICRLAETLQDELDNLNRMWKMFI